MKKQRKTIEILLVLLMIIGALMSPAFKTARAEETEVEETEVAETVEEVQEEEAKAESNLIDTVKFTITPPTCGTEVKVVYGYAYEQTPTPTVQLDKDANYKLYTGSSYFPDGKAYLDDYYYWDLFDGTYSKGSFYALVILEASEGYYFAEPSAVLKRPSNINLTVEGAQEAWIDDVDYDDDYNCIRLYIIVEGQVSGCSADDPNAIKEVSFEITPPECGEEVTVEWGESIVVDGVEHKTVKSQTTYPKVTIPDDAPYVNGSGSQVYAYWVKGVSEELNPFEGTYKGGTFYAILGFRIVYDYEPLPPTPKAEEDEAKLESPLIEDEKYFAEEVNIKVKGAKVVKYEVDEYGEFLTVWVKGTASSCEVETTPTPTPITVPNTGVDTSVVTYATSCVAVLGVCLMGFILGKKK